MTEDQFEILMTVLKSIDQKLGNEPTKTVATKRGTIGKKAAVQRIHAAGFSIAISKEIVAKLPSHTDGKRAKFRVSDIEKRIEEMLGPLPVPARGQGIFSERNIRSLHGRSWNDSDKANKPLTERQKQSLKRIWEK